MNFKLETKVKITKSILVKKNIDVLINIFQKDSCKALEKLNNLIKECEEDNLKDNSISSKQSERRKTNTLKKKNINTGKNNI